MREWIKQMGVGAGMRKRTLLVAFVCWFQCTGWLLSSTPSALPHEWFWVGATSLFVWLQPFATGIGSGSHMTRANPIRQELRSFALWLRDKTLSTSRAKDEMTKAFRRATSTTSRRARFEDDSDIRGKNGRTERKWVAGDGPELQSQPAQKLVPPLGFPVVSQSCPLGVMPI